jgi:hypothetical protein
MKFTVHVNFVVQVSLLREHELDAMHDIGVGVGSIANYDSVLDRIIGCILASVDLQRHDGSFGSGLVEHQYIANLANNVSPNAREVLRRRLADAAAGEVAHSHAMQLPINSCGLN